ncbi:MAG: ADOP family duplicated permease [Pseudomarimonas sp.]
MTSFWLELRHAWRSIAARPGFSALAVLVLAAGLASALSIASFMNTLVLNPLPFANAEQLYRAGLLDDNEPLDSRDYDELGSEEVLDWEGYLEPLAQFGAHTTGTINLSSDARSERYAGGMFSAGLLPALGVQPLLGRNFSPADQTSGAPAVLLISHAIWQQRFNADPQIVGRQVRVNAAPATVIGVMPPDFSFPMREQLWMPAKLERGALAVACCFDTVIRPKPGVTTEQIEQALARWLADARERDPVGMAERARAVGFDHLKYRFVDRETIDLFAVMGVAVGLVLLIACANVANLLLSSLLARERELALRMALGAGRGRLLLGLLLQSGLLSLFALLLALPLAQLGVDAVVADMRSTVDEGPPHWMVFAINGRMVGMAALCALATALLSGLLPALHAATRRDLSLRGQTHGDGGFARISQGLMVAQVGFSLAVLMTTLMLVKTVRTLEGFDLGLDTDKVLTLRIGLFAERFKSAAEVQRYVDDLLLAVRAEPSVESAAISTSIPGLMGGNVDALELGVAKPASGVPSPGYSAIDHAFLAALRAEFVAGRDFTHADGLDSELVAIVDQTFVDRHFGGNEPIGRRIVLDPGEDAERTVTVVGVVRAIQMDDIDDAREESIFVPFAQEPQPFFSLFVRTRGEPLAFAGRLNAISQKLDADTPLYWVRAYDDVLREAMIGQQLLARMFTSFGVIALLLAAAGLYGVVAFNVGRRTREIGIRRALGADNAKVLRAVLMRTGAQVALGLSVGMLIGIPFASLLSRQLGVVGDGNSLVDVYVWLPALLMLTAAAAVASWLPARRALLVEPNRALRYD